MSTPLRYICVFCGVDLCRCVHCQSLIHTGLGYGVSGKMHEHPPCPAITKDKGDLVCEVARA